MINKYIYTFIALIVVGAVCFLGIVYAYFSSIATSSNNVFHSGELRVVLSDTDEAISSGASRLHC